MPHQQTRIFLPFDPPYDNENWAETLVGRTIRLVVQEFPNLEWFWFSRYAENIQGSAGDCDIASIPEAFARIGIYRSVRFRYSVPEEAAAAFQERCLELIEGAACRVSDFRAYNYLDDLASKRFLGESYTPARREQRAVRMAEFLCATSQLLVDTLNGPDAVGRYKQEVNDETTQNPNQNTFESIHHLFCNITNVPTDVLVLEPVMGTRIYPENGVRVRPVRIRF